MASTRNNNTLENYKLQQHQIERQRDWIMDQSSRINPINAYPCYGINNPSMPSSLLCNNPVEVESFLFGISANNFVNPVPIPNYQPKQLANVKFFDKVPLYVPKQQFVYNQRPSMYN